MDSSPSATVVLVHGNFLGPWSWREVAAQLGANGISTVIAELPSSVENPNSLGDLHDDAAAVRRILDTAAEPVVLCGHSYGGAVITEAAAGPHSAVRRLVYLAGAVPDKGESLVALTPETARGNSSGKLGEEVTFRTDGRIELATESAKRTLFHDCATDRARSAIRQLRPSNPAAGTQMVRGAAWRQLPVTYVRCMHDVLPELVSESFPETEAELVELSTGHCPNWSSPEAVTEVLRRSVKQAMG